MPEIIHHMNDVEVEGRLEDLLEFRQIFDVPTHVVVQMTVHITMFWQEPILTEVYWTISAGRFTIYGYMYQKAREHCRATKTSERLNAASASL